MEAENKTIGLAGVIEHHREVNRMFDVVEGDQDASNERVVHRLSSVLLSQLGELELIKHHYDTDEQGDFVRSFDYVEPLEAIEFIVRAIATGKLPQPTPPGSLFYSDRTALGRQSALDTFREHVAASPTYDVMQDPVFFPLIQATDVGEQK